MELLGLTATGCLDGGYFVTVENLAVETAGLGRDLLHFDLCGALEGFEGADAESWPDF